MAADGLIVVPNSYGPCGRVRWLRVCRRGHTHKRLLASTTLKPPSLASTVHCAGKRLIGRNYRISHIS
jgi:hypothetical protein